MGKYFINPETGRTIKKNGRTFNELQEKKIKLEKDYCLYDLTSAKKCLKQLSHYYPELNIPSNNIPDVAVIKQNNYINGIVSKKGNIYKLSKPFILNKKVSELKTVSENHKNILNKILENSQIIDSDKVKDKLENTKQSKDVFFNPLQNNYITTNDLTKTILNNINNNLTPNKLPIIIPNTNVSGLISNKNEIIGYINNDNESKKFNESLKIKIDELNNILQIKTQEIELLKNIISEKIKNENVSKESLIELNNLLIKKENEKNQIEKDNIKKIEKLLINLATLNLKITKLEDSLKKENDSNNYYYSLIKNTLQKWNPIEDDSEKYKSYATWIKDLFIGKKTLEKTDNIESNLNELVDRANQYANSKRSKSEMQKNIADLQNSYKTLEKINNSLNERVSNKNIVLLESQVKTLTKDLSVANKRYNNSKITRDTLIQSYEKTIKGYIDAIESLKENNTNIGVELGLLKDKYNKLKELQDILKNTVTDDDYDFLTKYFNITQDYENLSKVIKTHEKQYKELQDKNKELEDLILQLQSNSDPNLIKINVNNTLQTYKTALKEFQTKYFNAKQQIYNLKNQNSDKLKAQFELSNTKDLEQELKKCKDEKNKIKQELKKCKGFTGNVIIPNDIVQKLPLDTETANIQKQIKDNIQKCKGTLKNELGIEYRLKWDYTQNKCIQEEVWQESKKGKHK
jgi:hypothetical protein